MFASNWPITRRYQPTRRGMKAGGSLHPLLASGLANPQLLDDSHRRRPDRRLHHADSRQRRRGRYHRQQHRHYRTPHRPPSHCQARRRQHRSRHHPETNYSRTSMARTSLGPWKFVRDMGSSSHWGLIMEPVQEANSNNLGIFSIFYTVIVCWVFSLKSPRWCDSNEYTQHTISW